MKLNPIEYCIMQFGGVRALARAIDRTPSTVSAWRTGVKRELKSGYIPATAMADILSAAKKQGLDIDSNDLIYGRTIKQKENKSWQEKRKQEILKNTNARLKSLRTQELKQLKNK